MPARVTIHGGGIAACCCARLLQRRDFHVSFTRTQPSSSPTLLINISTQKLLMDVFGIGDDLFSGSPIVRKRVVLWGSEPLRMLPHFGVVVNEAVLLKKLWDRVDPGGGDYLPEPVFTIHSGSCVTNGIQRPFGSRIAHTTSVQIRDAALDSCWVESLDDGWLFLLPTGECAGSLIAVGERPESQLEKSRLIAPQVKSVNAPMGKFAAFPRILDPLCSYDWLACGSAAMGFDPICGQGAGNAAREAILACAVIQRITPDQENPEPYLSHYSSRLLSGFFRHLNACRTFYASAGRTEWWCAELAALEAGVAWTRSKLSVLPPPQFRLNDFSLEAVS